MLIIGSSDFDGEGKETGNDEDSEGEVLEGLTEQLKESRGFSDRFLIGSVLGFSLNDLRLRSVDTFFEISFESIN